MERTLKNGWNLKINRIERNEQYARMIDVVVNNKSTIKIVLCSDGDLYSVKQPRKDAPAHVAAEVFCWIETQSVAIGLSAEELAYIQEWLQNDEDRATRAAAIARNSARRAKADAYDMAMNEGGEGYNPYRDSDPSAGDNTPWQKGDDQQ